MFDNLFWEIVIRFSWEEKKKRKQKENWNLNGDCLKTRSLKENYLLNISLKSYGLVY